MEDITDIAKRVFKNFNDKKKKVIIMICKFRVVHCYLQMCLKTLEINLLKYINFILLIFYLHQDWDGKHV